MRITRLQCSRGIEPPKNQYDVNATGRRHDRARAHRLVARRRYHIGTQHRYRCLADLWAGLTIGGALTYGYILVTRNTRAAHRRTSRRRGDGVIRLELREAGRRRIPESAQGPADAQDVPRHGRGNSGDDVSENGSRHRRPGERTAVHELSAALTN